MAVVAALLAPYPGQYRTLRSRFVGRSDTVSAHSRAIAKADRPAHLELDDLLAVGVRAHLPVHHALSVQPPPVQPAELAVQRSRRVCTRRSMPMQASVPELVKRTISTDGTASITIWARTWTRERAANQNHKVHAVGISSGESKSVQATASSLYCLLARALGFNTVRPE